MNRSVYRIVGYISILVCILVMSWEQAYSQPLLWKSQELPSDAIRLRILPNSDGAVDQWLKHRVRDAVTVEMKQWTTDVASSEQAQQLISSRIDTIQEIVNQTLKNEGFDYPVKVTLGDTDFPTVQYGEHIYPAGVYTAVLIEIGEAQGKNWWCVLYPPLCFVDIATAKTTAIDASESQMQTSEIQSGSQQLADGLANKGTTQKPEVQFFIKKLFQ
ncbi:stage II sporulation protein R [Desulfuribacillus stibiiarsenatis]|uniref:Stage II sporulation protein R n=1 Tax=Desulfuribacillus stibiiarsenatis TaxID=1390249 RepID=A0A1E5L5K6_9FIRM|nr:stage II sporulation protein R [Desulfuribacillus stibiiarsenatis]OEH85427.1 stage II sporulation protein R [Desulfuribacillus stibiiarsenatis]